MIKLTVVLIALSTPCFAWELPKVGVEGKVQDVQVYNAIKHNTHEPIYIYNDMDVIVDRIEIPKKHKDSWKDYGK